MKTFVLSCPARVAHPVVPDRLNGMDFGSRGGGIEPDEFLFGIDLPGAGHLGEDDVAVGEQGGVVEFLVAARRGVKGDGVGPDDPSVPDDEHRLQVLAGVPLAGIEEGVLGRTPAREGRCIGPKDRSHLREQRRRGECREKFTILHGVEWSSYDPGVEQV